MGFKEIKYSKKDNVGIVSIDSPPVNAFTHSLIDELDAIFVDLSNDTSTRALLLTSMNKKFFLPGGDVNFSARNIKTGDIDGQIDYVRKLQNVAEKLEKMPKPTIASINGHVLGGGLELAMAFDFRLMSDDTNIQLGIPEIDLGFAPGIGGLKRIADKFGQHFSLKMGLGLRLNPQEAFRIGLIDELYAPEDLLRQSIKYAQKLAQLPTKAVAMVKKIVIEGMESKIKDVNELEVACLREILETEDIKEGINAFLEKRKPNFRGK